MADWWTAAPAEILKNNNIKINNITIADRTALDRDCSIESIWIVRVRACVWEWDWRVHSSSHWVGMRPLDSGSPKHSFHLAIRKTYSFVVQWYFTVLRYVRTRDLNDYLSPFVLRVKEGINFYSLIIQEEVEDDDDDDENIYILFYYRFVRGSRGYKNFLK